MELDKLRQRANHKLLLRGSSGTGKTMTACKLVLRLLDDGAKILYIDTENEGSTTIVNLIEEGDWDEDIVEEMEYVQVDDHDLMIEHLERQDDFDAIVFDTLDHKHTYTLRKVTDAHNKADADWNQYPRIYSAEKQVMEVINKSSCNIIATIDPDSGKMKGKPKGTQTNVHGYFTIVVDLKKTGEGWSNKIVNWVNKSDVIGNGANNLVDALANEFTERI